MKQKPAILTNPKDPEGATISLPRRKLTRFLRRHPEYKEVR